MAAKFHLSYRQAQLQWNLQDTGNRPREFHLPSGIIMVVLDYLPGEDTRVAYDADACPVSFGFNLSMNSRSWLKTGLGKQREIDHPSLGTEIAYAPKSCGHSLVRGGVPVQSVCLMVPPQWLADFMGRSKGRLSRGLGRIANDRVLEHFRQVGPMSGQMAACARHILGCPGKDAASMIYLEAKAMELLGLRLMEMGISCAAQKSPGLSPEDHRRIKQAETLLATDLGRAPGLDELAGKVGLNRMKLSRGFKAVFGTTVHQRLRQLRFERVALLLSRTGMGVSEAAAAVGYSDLKHFYAGFREQYGMTPGQFRKQS